MNTEYTSTQPQNAQLSWEARLAEVSASGWPPQPLLDFLETPFPSILFGAAVYTGQSSLLQNTQLLLDGALGGGQDNLRTTCRHLLSQLHSKNGFEEPELYTMRFRLLVEPFARMNQYDAARQTAAAPSLSNDQHI